MAEAASHEIPAPDEWRSTKIQAEWLAAESRLPVEELKEVPLRELHERLRFVLDPELLFFRRVCGRVVKRDPASGEYLGVPNATVHVEDTDCSFLGFFPEDNPYVWFWPFRVRREEIGRTVTDSCGRFCAWIPRWDIDRVLRLRLQRVCLPEIVRPNLGDLLERLKHEAVIPKPHGPGPGPVESIGYGTLRLLGETVGTERADRLASLAQARVFGGPTGELDGLLSKPAFTAPPAPPLPRGAAEHPQKTEHPALREAERLGIEELDHHAYLGPFLRCTYVPVLEWQTVLDVPDITFRVTQDVDGDGDEETIYSEGFFDVRWDAGPIDPVTLVASSVALASPICEGSGEARECKSKPAFYTVGTMPLDPAYHDSVTGYALRVNRPRSGGLRAGAPIDPARTPYALQLALFACHRLPGATHQRVMYETDGVGPIPLFVPVWYAPTTPGQPTPAVPFTQDVNGWIEIRPADTLAFPDWVLHWPTPATGRYSLHVECRDEAGNAVGAPSDKVAFTVDNVPCNLAFGTIRWRELPSGGWTDLSPVCPVIRRTPGADVELQVPWSATSDHFRDATLYFAGCDSPVPATSEVATYDQWHDSVGDMSGGATASFEIAGSRPDGAYTLVLDGWTRGFQPRFDTGPEADFFYDPSHVGRWLTRAIAVVNSPA